MFPGDGYKWPRASIRERAGRMATAFLVEMHERPGSLNIYDYNLKNVFGNTTLRIQITI